LADVGLLMVYWPDREDGEALALGQPANLAPGFPTREELKARYAERSGRDLSELDFFIALGYWKLAIILEGVYARYTAGGYGEVNEGIEYFARLVERLAEAADEAEARGPSA
jgi:aminoglycoside phosphotransferase (APT) family kinase protein